MRRGRIFLGIAIDLQHPIDQVDDPERGSRGVPLAVVGPAAGHDGQVGLGFRFIVEGDGHLSPHDEARRQHQRGLRHAPRLRGGNRSANAGGRIRAQPFTEPAVSPCTMYFWKISTSSTAGSAPRKPEAAITE